MTVSGSRGVELYLWTEKRSLSTRSASRKADSTSPYSRLTEEKVLFLTSLNILGAPGFIASSGSTTAGSSS